MDRQTFEKLVDEFGMQSVYLALDVMKKAMAYPGTETVKVSSPEYKAARTALLSAFDKAARPGKMTRQEAEILVKSLAPTIEQCSKAGDVKQLWKAVQEVTNIEEKIIAAMTS